MVSLLSEISDLQVDMLDDNAVYLSSADASKIGQTDPVAAQMLSENLNERYHNLPGEQERVAYYIVMWHNWKRSTPAKK